MCPVRDFARGTPTTIRAHAHPIAPRTHDDERMHYLLLYSRRGAPVHDFARFKKRQRALGAATSRLLVPRCSRGETLAEDVMLRPANAPSSADGNGNATLLPGAPVRACHSTDYVRRARQSRERAAAESERRSVRPMTRTCRSPTAASTLCCRRSVRCSRLTIAAPARDAARAA